MNFHDDSRDYAFPVIIGIAVVGLLVIGYLAFGDGPPPQHAEGKCHTELNFNQDRFLVMNKKHEVIGFAESKADADKFIAATPECQ